VPPGEQMIDTLQALTRLPNLDVPSLRASVAALFGLSLDALLAHQGEKLTHTPSALVRLADRPLATNGDAVQTIDDLCKHVLVLLAERDFDADAIDRALAETFGGVPVSEDVRSVLKFVCASLVPNLRQTTREIDYLLHALDGSFVPAG